MANNIATYRQFLCLTLGLCAVLSAAPAFAACIHPDGLIGTIIYNPDFDSLQGCTARGWMVFDAPDSPSDCSLDGQNVSHGNSWIFYSAEENADCPSIRPSEICTEGTLDGSDSDHNANCDCTIGPIGTVCASDGAVYAGTTVGGARIYVADADQGSPLQWKTANGTTAGTSSATNGLANTDAMGTAGLADHPAGQSCRNRGEGWYLPATNELGTLYSNRAQLGAANLPTSSSWYWSSTSTSTEGDSIGSFNVWRYRFSDGSQNNGEKVDSYLVRCVRR